MPPLPRDQSPYETRVRLAALHRHLPPSTSRSLLYMRVANEKYVILRNFPYEGEPAIPTGKTRVVDGVVEAEVVAFMRPERILWIRRVDI